MVDAENFILRQILFDDDTTKLSLGNEAYTPLKIFLKKTAFDFHQYEVAKTYVLVNQASSPSRIWGYITLMNSEIVLMKGNVHKSLQLPQNMKHFQQLKLRD